MRTPEEHEQFLEHGRFGEKPDGTPLRPGGIPRWARIGCLSILGTALAIVLIAVSLNFLGRHFTKQIAADQRGQYGYSVDAYRWNSEGFKIRLRGENRFNDIRLDFPTLVLVTIHRRSWVAGGRAILLEMETEHKGDSAHVASEMLLLYDFQRGDLRSCGVQGSLATQEPTPAPEVASCRDLRAYAASLQ